MAVTLQEMKPLDDTTLHRPARHVRPEVHRRDARSLRDGLDAHAGEQGGEWRRALERERERRQRMTDAELAEERERMRRESRAEEREFESMAEAEKAQTRRERMLRKAAIPPTWQGASFADLDRDDRAAAIAASERWAAGELRGLLLWGEVGHGKTRIAATAALERIRVGPLRWLNVADLVMDLRGGFSSPRYEDARRMLVPVAGCALVLDDLDKLKPTDHAVQPIYLAINSFVEAELPLLVTLNRDLDELAADFGERFGEAVSSRLAGYCEQYEIAGRDRRLEP